jgi:hypothetical protein
VIETQISFVISSDEKKNIDSSSEGWISSIKVDRQQCNDMRNQMCKDSEVKV